MLSSTYVVDDYYMRQKMQNFIAIFVQDQLSGHHFHNFIQSAMARNKENQLLPGQSVVDRPDICARVFRT